MKKLKYLLMFAAVCAFSSCTKEIQTQDEIPQTPDSAYNGGEVEKGWVRIKLQESGQPLKVGSFTRGAVETGNAELDKIAQELGATEIVRVFQDGGQFAERRRKYGLHLWYDVRFDEEVPVTRAMTRFESLKGVDVIEPLYKMFLVDGGNNMPVDAIYTPAAVTSVTRPTEMPFNDPQLKDQWHYNNKGGNGATLGADINLFEAWKVETGKPNVIVSVHDEGVDVTHPDLAPNMWVNADEIAGNNRDDDDNGYADDINGWSYVNYSGNIPANRHGTHVSGTIAAVNNNGIGVCGVAGGDGTPNSGVRIMSCHVIRTGSTIVPQNTESYTYAADNGAVISQNSWTLGITGELPLSYADAFQYFIDNAGMDKNGNQTGPMKGGIIIFASANAGAPTFLPASSDKVIAVAATGPNYELTNYSNRGPEIDIVAPGGQSSGGSYLVWSLDAGGGTTALWGTSMACPHVSGVAALIVSKFGKKGFTAEECKTRLLNGYRPLGGYVNENNIGNVGGGLSDAAIALMEDPKTAPAVVDSPVVTANENNLKFSWNVPADGNGLPVKKYIVEYTGVTPTRAMETVTLDNNYDIGKKVEYTVKTSYNKKFDIKVYAVDRYGNKSAAVPLSVTTNNFDNKAPVRQKEVPNATINAPGLANKVTYRMIDYVYDANSSQGDILTYIPVSSRPSVVKAEMVSGNVLEIIPVARGTSSIVVTVTDLAGESITLSFNVTVETGGEPQVGGTVTIYPNPVEGDLMFELSDVKSANVDIAIYDSAARKMVSQSVAIDAKGKGTLNVAKIAPGVYTLVAKVDGINIKSTFIKK